jgi:hypothetical protein
VAAMTLGQKRRPGGSAYKKRISGAGFPFVFGLGESEVTVCSDDDTESPGLGGPDEYLAFSSRDDATS